MSRVWYDYGWWRKKFNTIPIMPKGHSKETWQCKWLNMVANFGPLEEKWPNDQILKDCKWCHSVTLFSINANGDQCNVSGAIWWLNLQTIKEIPLEFWTILTEIFIQVMESIVNTLGPLCLWQCFFNFPLIYSTLKMAVKGRWHAPTCVTHSVTVRDRSISISSSAVLLKQPWVLKSCHTFP